MLSKVCKKCGWVHPATTDRCRCVICGTVFEEGPCKLCGKYTPKLLKGGYCGPCYYKRINTPATRKWLKRHWDAGMESYEEWMRLVRSLPKDYPTLTEAQWLEACKHFNGCAFCGADSIDSRAYFISFADGGRYCDWNIVPACERCASRTREQPNPFIRIHETADRYAVTRITEYLEEKLNAAVATTRGSEQANNNSHSDE